MEPQSVVEARQLDVGVKQELPMRDECGIEQRKVRGVSEHGLMYYWVIRQRAVGTQPNVLNRILLLAIHVA